MRIARLYFVTLFLSLLGLRCSGCFENPVSDAGTGDLVIQTRILKPQGSAKSAATTWDSLVVIVWAADFDTIRTARKIGAGVGLAADTVTAVPAGEDRHVEVSTKSRNGITVHAAAVQTVDVPAGQSVPLSFLLAPACGSIYIELAGVPAEVDSVAARFEYPGDTLYAGDSRSGLMYLDIDYVPDGATGRLIIEGLDGAAAVIYCDTITLTFDAGANATLNAQFAADPSGLIIQAGVVQPGVTVVSGFMGSAEVPGPECGPFIVSEIMYYADGDSDYIEIANPGATPVQLDTLFLDIVSTSSTTTKKLLNVDIPAGGFHLVGDQDAPSSLNCDTLVNLDLPTTGRWILLKKRLGDGSFQVIDWVSYTSGTQEWPAAQKWHAIELDAVTVDPLYNNHGGNWVTATEAVAGTGLFGTPGR